MYISPIIYLAKNTNLNPPISSGDPLTLSPLPPGEGLNATVNCSKVGKTGFIPLRNSKKI